MMELEKKTMLSLEMTEMEGYCIAEILERVYPTLGDEFEKSVVKQYLAMFGFIIAPSLAEKTTDIKIKANRSGKSIFGRFDHGNDS